MDHTHPHRRTDILLGGALVLAGIVSGNLLFSEKGTQAVAQQASTHAAINPAIPAITLSANELALVKGNGGYYYLVNQQGQAEAVRFRDATLRTVPSESLLLVP